MILTPMSSGAFTPTDKRPGDIVFTTHRVQAIDDRGGVEPVPVPHPHAGPATPNHSEWPATYVWAIMGLMLGALVVWGACL